MEERFIYYMKYPLYTVFRQYSLQTDLHVESDEASPQAIGRCRQDPTQQLKRHLVDVTC